MDPCIIVLLYRSVIGSLYLWIVVLLDHGISLKPNSSIPQRIVEIKSLVTETENAVLTSSIDRSIKVWNLDYIFEKEHHIDNRAR